MPTDTGKYWHAVAALARVAKFKGMTRALLTFRIKDSWAVPRTSPEEIQLESHRLRLFDFIYLVLSVDTSTVEGWTYQNSSSASSIFWEVSCRSSVCVAY